MCAARRAAPARFARSPSHGFAARPVGVATNDRRPGPTVRAAAKPAGATSFANSDVADAVPTPVTAADHFSVGPATTAPFAAAGRVTTAMSMRP